MSKNLDEIAKPTIIAHTLYGPFGSNIPGIRCMDSGFLPVAARGGTVLKS